MSKINDQIKFILDYNRITAGTVCSVTPQEEYQIKNDAVNLVKKSIEGRVVNIDHFSNRVTIQITPLSFDLIEEDVVRIIL